MELDGHDMAVKRMDNMGIVVESLDVAIAFFTELGLELEARDAVEWAASVAVSVFHKNPLPVPVPIAFGEPLPTAGFPRCVWWNFWADLPVETDDLFQTQWLSINQIVEQLGSNQLVGIIGKTLRCATVRFNDALLLARCITQLSQPIPVLIEIEVTNSSITIRLRVYMLSDADIERVRVDLGDSACEWTYEAMNGRSSLVGFPATTSLVYNDDHFYELSLHLPRRRLHLTCDQTIAMFIGIGRQTKSSRMINSTLIPLTVDFQDGDRREGNTTLHQ